MSYSISIDTILATLFQVNGVASYKLPSKGNSPEAGEYQPQVQRPSNAVVVDYGNIEPMPDEESRLTEDGLWTPVLTTCEFPKGAYQGYSSSGQLVRVEYGGLLLPPTAVFGTNHSKNIAMTELSGGDGTFKEHIGKRDVEIEIVGILVDMKTWVYPREQVRQLERLWSVPKELEVICPILNDRGIYHLVIQSLEMPFEPDMVNAQPFRIRAVSDKPLTFTQRQL